MTQNSEIRLFENRRVRSVWDAEAEKWYISIVDAIEVLTDSTNPRKYWSVLKTRLKEEGSQLATNCSQLKMQSSDGKFYKTDVADVEQLFRLVQSVPSPKAEPFKLWLAQLGRERLDEASTKDISKIEEPQTLEHSKRIACRGGNVAGLARKELEAQTGQKVSVR